MNIFVNIFEIFYTPHKAIQSLKKKSITTALSTFFLIMMYYFIGNTAIYIVIMGKVNFNFIKVASNFLLFFITVIIYSIFFFLIYFASLYLIDRKKITHEHTKQFLNIFLFLSIIGFPFAKIGISDYVLNDVLYNKVSINPFLIGIFSPFVKLIQPKIISIMGILHLSGELGFFLIYIFNSLLFVYLIILYIVSQKKIFSIPYLKGFVILSFTILTCLVISYFDQLYFKLPSPSTTLYSFTLPK